MKYEKHFKEYLAIYNNTFSYVNNVCYFKNEYYSKFLSSYICFRTNNIILLSIRIINCMSFLLNKSH